LSEEENFMAAQTEHTLDTLNSLLRGELAATETYQQALAKVGTEAGVEQLRQIHVEHREAANTLRQHVHHHGGKPDQDSGAWGVWAKTVAGAAKLFGDTTALKALKEGEEHGVKSYEEALVDESVPEDVKTTIRTSLLPQTRAHLETLDRLMAG
jgi:uncharacterized protein (TIGR02284 family)